MTRLTKIEKETIILFNEGESTASIYTYNVGLKKRLAAFSKKYPDLCCLEKPEHLGGVSYLIDNHRIFDAKLGEIFPLFILTKHSRRAPSWWSAAKCSSGVRPSWARTASR